MSTHDIDDHTDTAVPLSRLAPRTDGYMDIRSYAAIGDGRTVALIAHDGSVDWYPSPWLDSVPGFARLLDADGGGCIELCPTERYEVTRNYIPGTNVLQTTFVTRQGTVRVTDSLNIGLGGRLPWGELARRIEGIDGHVTMGWRVAPGTGLATASPWVDATPRGPILRVGDLTLGVQTAEVGDVKVSDRDMSGTFNTAPGSRHLLAVVSTSREPLQLPEPEAIDRGIERTVDYWKKWSAELHYDGPWSGEVLRSALALKLLHSTSGAIAAAATTSLPENPEGGKNWDYRYAWVRDAAYTLHALIRFGEREEAHTALSWLLKLARDRGPNLDVMSRLDGGKPQGERELSVPGWRNVGPVLEGNRANDQLQLGIYADVFEMVELYLDSGHLLDPDTARLLTEMADLVCNMWQRADAGIWELPTDRHYTHSKMSCWQAIDSAIKLAELGHISGSVTRWNNERIRIREWVNTHCWSEALGSYTSYPGTDELDASVLLHAISAFDQGPRMRSTIDVIFRELGDGPLLYRFSGAQDEEATFVACSFWAVAALVDVGERERAETLMSALVPLANDVGLFAEMIVPEDRSFLGNFPQGLSHLALMTAALTLNEQY